METMVKSVIRKSVERKNIDREEPKIRTFWVYNNGDEPVGRIMVAYYNDRNQYHAGFALCNPKEQFCRKLGREIAIGRMKKRPVSFDRITDFHEVVEEELRRAFMEAYKNVSWVKRMKNFDMV